MDNAGKQWSEWRNKIIGLGEQSGRKNYYPELLRRLDEIKASEADLRSLFDSVTDAIFIHDSQGLVIDVNEAMLAMFQVTREQAMQSRVCEYSASEMSMEGLRRIWAELYQGRAKHLFEWKARRPRDDFRFDVEVAARATRWKNQDMIVAVVRDITERKYAECKHRELEQQLMQAQKLESIGRLAGGVAHDFNNMLQTILGNAALALENAPPGTPLRESLEEIQKSAQRSADLTRQLLAFARKQVINPKILDLNDTVAGMLKMLRRLIGEDIDLVWMPGPDLWSVNLDPSQVDQILANLSVNARDAIAGSGKVTIQTTNVRLDDAYAESHPESEPGRYVMLAVSDTGQGMDAETRARIFEPFFTTKEAGKGTGLGLAIVFGIVRQNNGHITVQSELGRGTTFKIYLPRAEAEPTLATPKTARPSRGGTETVLLVEDEQQILSLGRRILLQYGYSVLEAATPEIALALSARHPGPIHLLITDVVMPGLNGKELREQLRISHPDLKCLYMSGYTADVIAHHGILDPGVHLLEKPFTVHALIRKVREVLDQSQTAP
ncbi:MAG TPA: ATP-binding protein [Candidatus Paceibacterota bacterium]|nr:ATP-binding protein [Verrucomicrobiota bacterium]HRY48531.1 ATP-binding protein [Candidatus Paceibacterota bacterium]HRZ99276.1 ATP-binding protein [Candidatus Paceibacterota bacterium]